MVDTWEMIVEPERPIPVTDLEVVVDSLVKKPQTADPHLLARENAAWNDGVARDKEGAYRQSDDGSFEDRSAFDSAVRFVGASQLFYALEGAKLEENRLTLDVGVASWISYVGTSRLAEKDTDFRDKLQAAGVADHKNQWAYFSNVFAVQAAVVSSDGKIPLPIRGQDVEAPGNFHYIGGKNIANVGAEGVEQSVDPTGTMVDVLGNKLGTNEGEMYFLGVARCRNTGEVEMLYRLNSPKSMAEIESAWKGTGSKVNESLVPQTLGEISSFRTQRAPEIYSTTDALMYQLTK